jgi:putative membrane-bound dehydrogenase-like protein
MQMPSCPSRFTAMLPALALCALSWSLRAAEIHGILPAGADGRAMNLDFETGDMRDWTASGEAFKGQPLKGDVVNARRKDMKSGHQGQYWINSFERGGDPLQGTLTSAPFKVTQPWAAFLVAGGPYENTRVELVRKEDSAVIFKTSGFDGATFKKSNNASEELRPVVADLREQQGKEIFIRVVDKQDGHWAHINFDDFRLYAEKPVFAQVDTSARKPVAPDAPPQPADEVKFAGLSPEAAAKETTLPKGFKATLFAGEPDVVQPIAFCIDDCGRLGVVEGMDYPKRRAEGEGRDRILVFEDTDNDGKFNKRSVFMEKQNLISGIEVGFGGVWIGAAPHLMFVPVKDWDNPTPAGEAKILLDGWDYKRDTHETLNTFKWGPDGWLYGCHGVFCPSLVGKPGTPEKERQWVDAAVWRYHPTKHEFEIFAEGTSNPWGVDFDERGQCFIEACVVPHFWHVIQGARYTRQGGEHYTVNAEETARNERHRDAKSGKSNFPYVYEPIKTHGDHVHYSGSKGPHGGNNRSDAAGGGHAHAGLLVYQGDSFPAEYRGKIFMNNIHGQRINMDIPVREGSGFVGKHGADFAHFNDKWSQIIDLRTGPDGSIFMIDWYDKNQCHHNDMNGHDRSNGRIFKVSYGESRKAGATLAKLKDEELVALVPSKNEFMSQHARRILQERHFVNPGAVKSTDPFNSETLRPRLAIIESLTKLLTSSSDTATKLRALWTLHAVAGLSSPLVMEQFKSDDEYVRGWAIQLSMESKKRSTNLLNEFARLAKEDPSPVVRLYLASACQRLSLAERKPILENLIAHAEDAKDHNLPLMYWYATEGIAAQGAAQAVPLLGKAKIPKVREFITRRMAAASQQAATK